jgi:hypothetical protein
MYRQFFDRFNVANYTYDTGSFGGHINAELIPKMLDLQVYGAHGALGRFRATPFPDAALAQDGTIMPLQITSAAVGLIWHTLPTLDLYTYAGLEKAKAAFMDVGTVPFGYGNPLYNNTGCNIENSPAATCNGNTKEIRQFTAGFYDTVYRGKYGTVKAGVQYSYNQRFAFDGVGGAPKTDDNIVMSQLRYYPFDFSFSSPSPRSSRGEGWGEGLLPHKRWEMDSRRVSLTRIAFRFAACDPTSPRKRGEVECGSDHAYLVLRFVQFFVRTAEVGRGGILADLDDAAANGAGAGEMVEQRFAVAATDRARQLGKILVEGAEHFQHRLLVGEEHVAPHRGIGGGDAGEITKTAGREFNHLGRSHLCELVRGADNGVGDQMRQMAGDGEHEVMMIRRHHLDLGAHRGPERAEPVGCARIGSFRRRQDAPAVDEELGETGIGARMFGARDGMRRHEMDVGRQMRRHVARDGAFD